MSRPLVSLCMIVKNEEENLLGCLESVRGLVDEIVVVDTGSSDKTVDIAKRHRAKVFHFPWRDDFAAARNESLAHATGDWIFYLDADERLVQAGSGDCLREAASRPGVDAWSVGIRNYKHGTDAFDLTRNIRLFRRLPEVSFENEVHERVEPSLSRIGAAVAPADAFTIDHFGYSVAPEAFRSKLEKNLLLSRKHFARRPDDPYCLYYIGITLLLLGRHDESRRYLLGALESPGLPAAFAAVLCNAVSYMDLLGGDAEGALTFAKRSAEMTPRQNTAYLLSGLAHFRKSEFNAALPCLTKARDFLRLAPEDRPTDLSQEYAFIEDSEFERLIAICHAETNRYAEAAFHFREYMKAGAADAQTLKRAGICLINSGDLAGGLEYLERAESMGADRCELALPMAFARVRLHDFGRARSLLDSARVESEADREVFAKINSMIEAGLKSSPVAAPVSGKPSVSLCMIVKNEEQNLPGCLESVRGLVDEIVVVDTGSSDRTVDIAKQYGANVFHIPWPDDFSAARNESLRHATGDWVIFLDADEVLDPHGERDCLREAASTPGIDAFLVPIMNERAAGETDPTIAYAVRFFRRIPGILFSGKIHETVDKSLYEAGAKAGRAGFLIDHSGYNLDQEGVRKKGERNLKLFEKELAENPENAFARYHFGMLCLTLGREREAREAFDLALRGRDTNQRLEAMILNMKGYLHLRAGEVDAALDAAARSLALVSAQNTARLLTGLGCFRRKEYAKALPFLLDSYRFISSPPSERKSDIFYEDSIDRHELVQIIGVCFSETDRFSEAVPFLKLTAGLKQDRISYERLGLCLFNTGDYRGAAEYLLKAEAAAPGSVSFALPLSFSFFRMNDFGRAASYFHRARPGDAGEAAVALKLLKTMAAEPGFRRYLPECVEGKRDLFSRALPDEFREFDAQFGLGRPVPGVSAARMEAPPR